MNSINIIGRLGADPEIRYTPKGIAVTDLNLAVDDGWGENKKTAWVPVTVWGATAELAGNALEKGDRVAITGRITMDTWQDRDTGKERSKLKVVCDTMTLIEPKKDGARSQSKPQQDNIHVDEDEDIPF